ncbi:MAG: hypothetical protein OXG37_12865 [Actinomycetia bacterium]|nr:hypothetical protein [Actinomycetes bacterium]
MTLLSRAGFRGDTGVVEDQPELGDVIPDRARLQHGSRDGDEFLDVAGGERIGVAVADRLEQLGELRSGGSRGALRPVDP